MEHEITIKYHLVAFPKITVPVGDAPFIGYITSLSV